jgi:probable rRNA maturation factor
MKKYQITFQTDDITDEIYRKNKKDLLKILKETIKKTKINGNIFVVSLNLFSQDKIRDINNEHRDINKTTDVLSFPQMELFDGTMDLGDIFINYEILDSQAKEIDSDANTELKYLFMHGLLHLVGHDHLFDDDFKLMRDVEKQIFTKTKIRKDI